MTEKRQGSPFCVFFLRFQPHPSIFFFLHVLGPPTATQDRNWNCSPPSPISDLSLDAVWGQHETFRERISLHNGEGGSSCVPRNEKSFPHLFRGRGMAEEAIKYPFPPTHPTLGSNSDTGPYVDRWGVFPFCSGQFRHFPFI